ncbi:MAG TPA: ThuA domain-containing protein [Ktedonobacteraceae bacterium]|nr:ThuA domain-containing protein [Ktedonobacteraceae bacterium]
MSRCRHYWITIVLCVLATVCCACGNSQATQFSSQKSTPVRKGTAPMILVFSKTMGYRHASIGPGIAAIKKLAQQHHVRADFTEDAAAFTDNNLARYQAVVFLNTTGTLFDDTQRAAFERYIHAGGGYAGTHSATDTEYLWPWYDQLLGTHFLSHPSVSKATLHVEDRTHPSTSMLPEQWTRTDEWYNFRTNPRKYVHVLITVDETSYQGGKMGQDHPIAWYHDFDGGQAWYTALGHTSESFSEPLFLQHLWGGISYAAGWSAVAAGR